MTCMRTLRINIALWLLAALFAGCMTTKYTLYLQDVTVSGPISQAPVHITNNMKEKPFRVAPHIAINSTSSRNIVGQIEGHSMVNRDGVYQVDTIVNSNNSVSFRERPGANNSTFKGKNLQWKMPDAIVGADFDYAVSNHLAISFGADYSTVGATGLWGYSLGLGLFSEDSTSAFRVDGGIRWQALAYEAYTAVVVKSARLFSSNTDESVGFFRDKGTSTPMDFYVSLIFNTKRKQWFANIFMQLAISKQSLAKFKPTVAEGIPVFPLVVPEVVVHDARANFASTVFSITPGLYMDINSSARIVAGVHINMQTEIADSSPSTVISPLLQFEWSL